MCKSPKQPKDNSAEIARAAEERRQGRITAGTANIDNAFSGFNDNFYRGHQDAYSDYYQPQLDDQHADARKRLTLQLARTGNLSSSAGANQMADLKKFYDTQNTSVANRGLDAVNTLRGNVDQRKSQLYNDNRSAADPGSAASMAASAASSLQPSAPTSPLANVFNDFFGNIGNAMGIQNQASGGQQGSGARSFGGSKPSHQNF